MNEGFRLTNQNVGEYFNGRGQLYELTFPIIATCVGCGFTGCFPLISTDLTIVFSLQAA